MRIVSSDGDDILPSSVGEHEFSQSVQTEIADPAWIDVLFHQVMSHRLSKIQFSDHTTSRLIPHSA